VSYADKRRHRILIIKAKGGLGNRILSAVTGLVYADLTGRTPVIDWRDGTYGGVGENAYSMLFQSPLPNLCVEDYEGSTSVTPEIWRGNLGADPTAMISSHDPSRHRSATIYRKYCTDLSRLDAEEEVAVFWSYLPKFGRLGHHLRVDPRFAGRAVEEIISEYLARYFTPNERIQAGVSEALGKLSSPIIGVHVRYTDLKIPIGKVKRALRRRRAASPGGAIFLATDSASVQVEIASEFDNVHWISKYLPEDGAALHSVQSTENKTAEAENAMIDMWSLSACDYLIYSKNSTFSVASALLGSLRPEQQEDVDRFNVPVIIKRVLQQYL
jgi:hypothetical protein